MKRLPHLAGVLLMLMAVSRLAAQVPITAPWGETTPLPEPSYYTRAVSYGNHVLVFKCWPAPMKIWVGDVGPGGQIPLWRETLPPPAPFPSFFLSGLVRVNEYVVIPGSPNSFVAKLGEDGSIVSWTVEPGTPNSSQHARGVEADGNRIYSVAGSSPGGVYFQGVDMTTIDAAGHLAPWQAQTPLPIPLLDPMTAVADGNLYVFGGESTNPFDLTASREVRRAGIGAGGALGSWEPVRGLLREARPHSSYLRKDGTLHLVGGGLHSYMTETVETVLAGDLGLTDRHVVSRPLPVKLAQMGTAVVGSFAYAMGGVNSAFGATWTNQVWVTRFPDSTAPVITSSVAGLAGENGWYRDTVTVTWNVSDGESGIGSSTGCGPTVVSVETAGTTLTCSATNGDGLTVSASVTVKMDRTAPLITSTRTPLPNVAGWNNTDVTVGFGCVDGLSGVGYLAPSMTVVSGEGANQSAAAACTDLAGNRAEAVVGGIQIDKTRPGLAGLRLAANPLRVNANAALSAELADALSGLSSWQYTVGGGPAVVMTATRAGGAVTAGFTRSAAGVYPVCAKSVDAAGNASAESCLDAVFYDPGAGMLSGSGWFDSPDGATVANPSATGRVNFGLDVKYEDGRTRPSGDVEFEIRAGDLHFHSTSFEWMVVAGATARVKGSGTINGAGDYEFLVTVIDGGGDRIRVQIRQRSGGVVYDTQIGAADGAEPVMGIGGGDIRIHR